MPRIESLTAAQQSQLAEYRDAWIEIGLCTKPADRPRAEAGVRLAYKCAGLEPPQRIVWCGSPLAAGLTRAIVFGVAKGEVKIAPMASVGASVRASVWDSVWASVRASVWDSVWDSVGASVGDSVWDSVNESCYGQHDASWLAFYRYFRDVCGLDEQTQKLAGHWEVSQAANWWLPHSNICWISERHGTLNRNERGQLHCESAPALAYPDGFSIWAIDGVRLDEQIILRPESQTIQQIDAEKNSDIRSIRIARFGWPRYLKESGAKCRDHRDNEITGTPEALYKTKNGEQRLVVGCSTGRVFALGVPAEIATCEQAQHWLAGDKKFNILAAT